MTESPIEEQGRGSRSGLQWQQIFHAFRLSVSVPQILIASAGVIALAVGNWAFAQLPFVPEGHAEGPWPWSQIIVLESTEDGVSVIEPVYESCRRLLAIPIESVYRPAAVLLSPENDWLTAAFAWTQLLWALIVWAIVAGAITRMAAVQFAVEQSVGLRAALRFSSRRFLSYLTSPLLPGAGLLLMWMLGLVGGWIGMIPTAGPAIAGALWFLGLLVGFVMAMIAIGIAGGWPLMYATISVEGSDAFDGFSRSFSYVFSRPRQWIAVTVASAAYGLVATGIGIGVAVLVVYLAAWSTASGMGIGAVANLMADSPFHLPDVMRSGDPAASDSLGASFALFWLYTLAVLVCGFAVSLFWSISTVAYLVLRQNDDGKPVSEVYLPEEAEEDDLLPLVGVAASDQAAIERPLSQKPDDSADNNEEPPPETSVESNAE